VSVFGTESTPDYDAFKYTTHLELLLFTGSPRNPLLLKTSSPTKLIKAEIFP